MDLITILLVIFCLVALVAIFLMYNKQQQGITQNALLNERVRQLSSEMDQHKIQNAELQNAANTARAELGRVQMAHGIANGELEMIRQEKLSLIQQLQEKTREWIEENKMSVQLKSELDQQSTLYREQKTDLEQLRDKMHKEFSLLAHEILSEKTKSFNESQQKEMSGMLEPLKTNLKDFKEQVEKSYKTESEERISLRAQVNLMMELNSTLAKEARSLAVALSGNTKKQGDWGEWILETILEYSGLQKGVHYEVQASAQDEAGGRIRPDVIVKYPDERVLIIDSKVSLSHYDQLCREEDPDTQVLLLKSLQQSLRNHIDGLSGKNYPQFKGSLDMVIMFLPVEAAYITALQGDPDLQHYAYRKNVLMVSPANLVVAMKLIYDLWKRDGMSKNAAAIAEKAGKLYDKVVGFVEDFQRIGKAIDGLQFTYNQAHNKLTNGRGAVLKQAEDMRKLEIKNSKKLPPEMVSELVEMNEDEPISEDEQIESGVKSTASEVEKMVSIEEKVVNE